MRIGKMIKYEVVAFWDDGKETVLETLSVMFDSFERVKKAALKYKAMFDGCEIEPKIIIRRLEVKIVGTLEV